MYTEMSPETADFIKMMFDRELFDVVAKRERRQEDTVAISQATDVRLYSPISTERQEMWTY